MRPRLYLDTSVVSALVDPRTPERQQATADFWTRLDDFDVSVSDLTLDEIHASPDQRPREEMLERIGRFTVLTTGEEARTLARQYVRRAIFPHAAASDALHVAIAVVARQDILVSWNFRHLVNRRRRALINQVNIALGHPAIDIVSPPEI